MFVVEKIEPRFFEFEIEGETYKVKAVDSMDADTALAYAKAAMSGNDIEFLGWLLDNVFHDVRDVVGKLNLDQIKALVAAYLADSKADAGESQA